MKQSSRVLRLCLRSLFLRGESYFPAWICPLHYSQPDLFANPCPDARSLLRAEFMRDVPRAKAKIDLLHERLRQNFLHSARRICFVRIKNNEFRIKRNDGESVFSLASARATQQHSNLLLLPVPLDF